MKITNDLAAALRDPKAHDTLWIERRLKRPEQLDRLGELVNLEKLRLDACPATLPAALVGLKRLTDLAIGDGLEEVPPAMKALGPRLETLHLNGLQREEEVAAADRLLRLLAPAKKLTEVLIHEAWELPEGLAKLAGPFRLFLEPKPGADLGPMLALLARCRGLERLDLRQPKAKKKDPDLPLAGLGALKQLRHLRLTGGFTSLPDELGQLSKLVELDLEENAIATLPDGLRRLKRLERLAAKDAGLRALPDWVHEWTALRDLDVGSNPKLRSLPASLARCKLARLRVAFCEELAALPPGLERVKELDVAWTPLEAAVKALRPPSKRVELLDVDAGEEAALETLEAAQPKTLRLDLPALKRLPDSVARLERLEELWLGTPALDLAHAFELLAQVKGLRHLSLVTKGPIPKTLGRLTGLTTLSVRGAVTRLPDEVGQLRGLRSLALGKSQIDRLPDAVGDLAKLTSLSVGPVRALPDSLARLTKLAGDRPFVLDGTRLPAPPPVLARLRVEALDLGKNTPAWRPAALFELLAENAGLKRLRLRAGVKLHPAIGGLQVRSLDLREHDVGTIPLEVGRCPNLERLELKYVGSAVGGALETLKKSLPGRWKKHQQGNDLSLTRTA